MEQLPSVKNGIFLFYCHFYLPSGSLVLASSPSAGASLSKNVGMSLPVKTFRSIPDSSIVAIRMTPPDDPSRDIARATAAGKERGREDEGRCEGGGKGGGEWVQAQHCPQQESTTS